MHRADLLLVGRDKGTPIDISVDMGRELSQYSSLSGEDRARLAEALRDVTIVELDGVHNLQGGWGWGEARVGGRGRRG